MGKKSGFLLFFLLLVWHNLPAQSITGNIEGWITDMNNQPVVSANISAASPDFQGSRGTSTDERGYFRISALTVGSYFVRISHISYQQNIISNVKVLLGQTTSLGKLQLKEHTIETQEVVVSAEKPVIDARSTTTGKTVSNRQFSSLPIERNYLNVAELLPHANQSYKGDGGTNFAGATGIENRYFIDGADVTEPAFGAQRFDLPYNFIREIEIRTGGYQAEYQSSLGGIVNAVTYSGSNEMHGTVFGFFTNNNFSKAPRAASGQPPKGEYFDYDVGFGLGGSFIYDKLWYYFAYDPNFVSEYVPVTGLEMQHSYSTRHKFAGKLTWNIDKSNLLTLSISGDPSSGKEVSNYGTGLIVLSSDYSNYNFTSSQLSGIVNGVHIINDALLLQSSFSIIDRRFTMEPSSKPGREPFFDDYVTGTASGGFSLTRDNHIRQLGVNVKGTLTLSNHIVKAGLEYQQNSMSTDKFFQGIERHSFQYVSWNVATIGTVKQHNPSAFIQDSWQISRRFCLNAGMRWDPQWLIASDGSLGQKITDQIQPRIGVIYQPSEIGSQKITASFGRFYQPLHLNLATGYHLKDAYYYVSWYSNDPRVDTSGAYTINLTPFVTNVPGVKGQYFDEITLGYERLVSTEFKFGIRGIYRWFGQGVEDGIVSESDQEKFGSPQVYGNPGSGPLSMLPEMKRRYTALELTLERFSTSRFGFFLSYILSGNWGNYDGLATTSDENGGAMMFPNTTNQFGIPERMNNADGLLPNDRTHVIKFFGSYSFGFGLTSGIVFQWMSGTPLNEFGVDPVYGASTFLQQRGSAGRTPSIWDLSFRFMYDLSNMIPVGMSARLIADFLHVASQKTELDYDQYHYWNYEQTDINSHYLVPVQFQPPMSVRLGMEVNF